VGARRVDYEQHGRAYGRYRRPDERIASRIHAALGDARTVLNVGAGTGSYEPSDRWVLAVEPSATMRAQRPAGAAPVIAGRAEALPFDDDSVDAVMACLTVHHWESPELGLAELRRVARGAVVIFTFDLDCAPAWQQDFLHEGLLLERPRFRAITDVAGALGGQTRVEPIATPGDCVDGFIEAFWRRPEALLDPAVRASQSMWSLLGPGEEARIVERLAEALSSGAWDTEYGHLRQQATFDGALRLVISEGQSPLPVPPCAGGRPVPSSPDAPGLTEAIAATRPPVRHRRCDDDGGVSHRVDGPLAGG